MVGVEIYDVCELDGDCGVLAGVQSAEAAGSDYGGAEFTHGRILSQFENRAAFGIAIQSWILAACSSDREADADPQT